MKNIFRILLIIFTSFLVYSCQERDTEPRIGEDAITAAKFVNPPSGEYTVTALNLANPFHTFILNRASYGTDIQIKYQLEIAKAGTNFSPAINLGDYATTTNIAITFNQLNEALASLGLDANVKHDVEVRLKATPNNTSINSSYSDVAKFTVTPYEPNYDAMFPKIYMPGVWDTAALGGYSQWDPANSPRLYAGKTTDPTIYTGFQYLAFDQSQTYPLDPDNGAFKFTPGAAWTDDFGDDKTRTGKLTKDGEWNIKSPNYNSFDTYFLKVDTGANTYSLVKANMGIVGEATPTGWGGQTDLVYNPSTKMYEISSIALTPGVFKFRNDGYWGIKLQPKDADVTIESGKKIQIFNSANEEVKDDPNFKITTAGNYKVVVDLHNSGFYNMTITKL